VIIEIPQDISMAQADIPPYTQMRRVRFGPDPYDIDKLIELMRESKRPLIYVGRGALWSRATEDLVKVAEAYALPVMATLPAKGAMPEDHPLCLGLGGYPRAVYSTGQSKKFAEDADLVIALGCSFRQHATSSWLPKPAHAKLVQVDIDPAELHKNYPADLVMLSDIKLFLQALLQQGTQKLSGWRKGMSGVVSEEIGELKKIWMDSWNSRLTSEEVPINPYRACWDLTKGLDRRNTVLLHDAGVTRAYVSHHYEALFPNGFIGFGGTSAMGWSTPAALGAKLGNPDKTVVNVTGDVTVPAGHVLTIESNTVILIDGVASGTSAPDIFVGGTVNSLGTEEHPVTITCASPSCSRCGGRTDGDGQARLAPARADPGLRRAGRRQVDARARADVPARRRLAQQRRGDRAAFPA